MLYPFWGKNPENPERPNSGRYDRYTEAGRSFFQMTSLHESDIAVLPAPWEDVLHDGGAKHLAEQFVEYAREQGKPTVIFFWSDSDEKVPLRHTVVFRTSLYRSRRAPNEFAMPAWSEDFVERYCGSELPVRPKRGKPVVGFCGASEALRLSVSYVIKRIAERVAQPIAYGKWESRPTVRPRALRTFSKSHLVETNFVVRSHFLGGALKSGDNVDLGRLRQVRKEYVDNMLESDYILCVRGVGNYSYRLYETLCCGRIPVFVDTDCVLPYDFMTDWRNYCVWVEEREVHKIAEKVAEFHSRLSPKDFIELQHACRRFWEKQLSPVGFFSTFHHHFTRGVVQW
jgi:hypothetical protein